MDYFGFILGCICISLIVGYILLASRIYSRTTLKLAGLALATTAIWALLGAVAGYIAVQHDDAFYTGGWTFAWHNTLWLPFSLSYAMPPIGAFLGQSTFGIALESWLWLLFPLALFALAVITNRVATRRTKGTALAHS